MEVLSLWLLFVVLSFLTGWLVRPWWSILVWPAGCIVVAAWLTSDEPPNYDMHGISYVMGGFVAALSVLAWLAGRVLAASQSPAPSSER